MHFHFTKIVKVISCSSLIISAGLAGFSHLEFGDVSGCWSGNTLNSLSAKDGAAVGGLRLLPMQRSSVEINFLRCALRDSRQNPQVSALFTEEDNYAR